MVTVKNINQKVKGKLQQIQGSLEERSGERVKGTITKIKGKLNEASADAKIRIDK